MKKNMGSTDQIIRVLLALVFAWLFYSGTVTGIFGYALLALGAVFIVTSIINYCPIYALFGFSTCPLHKKKA